MKKNHFLFAYIFFLFLNNFFYSQSTPIPNLSHYKLENGLSLFVVENHAVPLTYIEIAVKCGAYTQSSKNAGLFHLYEHMMFKGNSLYPNAASVTRALSQMGVAEWNGSTGIECVNYYFTVPSDQTETGLKFWNAAIREPLLDKKELKNEKKVVLSEIRGNYSDPGRIFSAAKCRALFSECPWKMDSAGSDSVVKNATIRQLKEIQKEYYIPNNSAVFVGGDVNPDEIYMLVKQIFDSWEKAENPFEKGIYHHNKNPFNEPKKLVMPYEKISTQLAQIEITYRGPDAFFDLDDTYSADVFSQELSDPNGIYKTSLTQDGYIGIPNADYVWGGYPTMKQCGLLSFGALVTSPNEEIVDRTLYFANKLPEVLEKSVEIKEDSIKNIVRKIKDSDVFVNETASGLLSTLRFWWICTDENYYYTYSNKISYVQQKDLENFVKEYIKDKKPLITVLINPDIYEELKNDFAKAGFQEITASNAFWFKDIK